MKKNLILYILSFLGFIAFSCNDEAFMAKTGEGGEEEDGLTLSLKIDVPQTRTRAIDMTQGGALYLNNIWVGVYNRNNGNLVMADSVDLHSRLTESGVTLTDVIKLKTTGTYQNTDYCVVGVANYYGIKTFDGRDLMTALKNATTWKEFANISIDSQQDIPNQTPVLMGYLTGKTGDETKHTVIDQFNESTGVNVANNSDNQTDVFVRGITSGNGLNSKNYVMNLRRLRSKININLTTRDDQMTITNLEYKVVNVPRSSFLVERNTVDDPERYTDTKYSPNSADAKGDGYITLDDLNQLETEGWQKTTDNYSFSYEHVENKHWAKKNSGLTDYHSRGKQSDVDGSFTNLANSAGEWNNNASYIVLRINIRDFRDGRNSLIEYTIMEGFCNNAYGISQVDSEGETSGSLTTRLQDFSCFRNTDYYYNIDIKSVNEIYTTVVTDNGSHPYDQHNGNIWQMKYPEFAAANSNLVSDARITVSDDATLTFKDQIDCTEDEDGLPLAFEDIGFRLAGSFYDVNREEKIPVDLCYNVAHGELEGFSGLWNDPINGVTEYFVDTKNEDSGNGGGSGTTALEAMNNYLRESHPDVEEMLSRFTVNADGNNTGLKITEFIQKLKTEDVNKITGVNVKGIRLYETAEESDGPRNHMIGLYIFDRKRSIPGGERVKTDAIGDCHYYQIRAIEQYPAYLTNAIYERIFAQGNNGDRMSNSGGTTQQINNTHTEINGGKNMILSEDPDIAFRLIGYYDKDGSGEYNGRYDLCYNFDMNEYPWFNRYMPAASYDTRSISKTALTRENIPDELLNGIRIREGNNGTIYTIKQFITRALAGNISSTTDYRFVFSSYGRKYYDNTETERYNCIRGLYIFDKKDRYKQPVLYDESTNSATYQIYAAEQDAQYVPPVKLPLPSLYGSIQYTHTATYNIIEENVGEIRVPLLPGYNYNENYYYRLYTLDDSGSSRRECKLEKIKSQNNGYATFYVPMSIAHANARDIYIQSKTLSDRLLDSDDSNNKVGRTGTLENPEWDFTDDNWNRIYRSGYFVYRDDKFRTFTDNTVEFSGGYGVPPITLYAPSSKEIRGSVVENDGFLYINNDACKVIINIYRSCKIKVITVGPYGSTNQRSITATAGDFATSFTYTNSKATYNNTSVPNDNGEHLELSFSIGGGSGNIYYIKLTD